MYRIDGIEAVRLVAQAATGTIGSGANGTVSIEADAGEAGNAITVTVVAGTGESSALAAAISGSAITVTLATNAEEEPDNAANTATLVAAAIDALDGVSAEASGNGSTVVTPQAGTLSGGRDVMTVDRLAERAVFPVVLLQQVIEGRPVRPHEAARIASALVTDLSGIGAVSLV